MEYNLEKTDTQFYLIRPNDKRFTEGELYREYHKAMGCPGYLGHTPGRYWWQVFVETRNDREMNVLDYFKTKKEATEFLDNL